jgi:pimeloyl-ACP methyl ester carboxylesterase
VLIHGNGSMVEDFACSLVEPASRHYRVLAFDRPGFGHSERPKDRTWTPLRQAKLLRVALRQLGVERPILLGHSFGALVALAYALSYPREIAGVVLESGYYFPTPRAEVPFFAIPAVPVLGALHRHTVGPLISRLVRDPLLKQLFAPNAVPAAFDAAFPREMTLRPGQLRAVGEDSAVMRDAARHMSRHYAKLPVPSFILAGESDRAVDPHAHSVRLHRTIPHSAISIIPRTGHMLHQIRPHEVPAAIDAVREAASAGQVSA